MTRFQTLLATTASLLTLAGPALAAPADGVKNVVLVHGAFADGSGWKPVADLLAKDGYKVSIVQEPETSLEDDVAATNRILDREDGPTVLVGHSYGGAIITEAGNNEHVKSLVYVAALQPDEGESVAKLTTETPGATKGIAPTADGYLFLDPKVFAADFAADVPKATAEFMAISEVPVALKAFTTEIKSPAWKVKPSYGIVATQDRALNPDLERSMYKRSGAKVTELKSSHAVFLSHPREVANVIEQAAHAAK